MPKAEFVYVTYIKTKREKVRQALTDPQFTAKYRRNHANVSDWQVGSSSELRDATDCSILDVVGTVLEKDYPRKPVFAFVSPREADQPDKHTKETCDILQNGPLVKLIATRNELDAESGMFKGISNGWPEILASLKTMLETGEPLPSFRRRENGTWVVEQFQ